MPSPAPDPLTSRPLTIWLVDPFDDIPGEGTPPLRYWSLARVLADRGHDVTWWTATWSHRRKAYRTAPLGIREDEGFGVRMVGVRPYHKNVSLARLASHRDFGTTFERLASEGVSSGQLGRPDIILASLPPLGSPEAAQRLASKLDATFILDVMDLWPETFERLLPGPGFLRRLLSRFFLGTMAARRQAVVANADALSAATNTYAAAVFSDAPPETPRHVCLLGAYVDEFANQTRSIRDVPHLAMAVAPTDGATAPDATPLLSASLPPRPASRRAGDRALGLFAVPATEPAGDPPLECVYAGSLEASQDLEILPAVARQLSARGIRATIHVAGTGKLAALLDRAAASATGSCRLAVHGLLDRPEYVRLLSRCEVGLVCVKPESMVAIPYKAYDYAAAGLAIVNSLPGEFGRLITQYEAGVAYTAGDAGSLAAAIASLAADRTRLMATRQAARCLAEREFDREKTYAAFADWIETVRGGG
jgi:glycosyltransferase involved in cell wall biosynthesis